MAQEAFEVLREKGMKYKVVTITAKEKLCFMDETKCDPVHCPYARGHFDRVNDAVYELWTTKSRYDRETIREQAEKWQVCPFEMCLDLSLWVDAVICDYNYVFDPTVHLKRFSGKVQVEIMSFSLMKLIIWQNGEERCTALLFAGKMLFGFEKL